MEEDCLIDTAGQTLQFPLAGASSRPGAAAEEDRLLGPVRTMEKGPGTGTRYSQRHGVTSTTQTFFLKGVVASDGAGKIDR